MSLVWQSVFLLGRREMRIATTVCALSRNDAGRKMLPLDIVLQNMKYVDLGIT